MGGCRLARGGMSQDGLGGDVLNVAETPPALPTFDPLQQCIPCTWVHVFSVRSMHATGSPHINYGQRVLCTQIKIGGSVILGVCFDICGDVQYLRTHHSACA